MFVDHIVADVAMRGAILAAVGLLWVVLLVRILGLRSLSKMTSFDFVMTVASGSLLAGAAQATTWQGFAQALVALAAIFATQYVLAKVRKVSDSFEAAISNEAVILIRDGKIIHRALKRTRVSEDDLYAKLREANVLDISTVRAAVLETTGDVSVLHGERLENGLLKGVKSIDEK